MAPQPARLPMRAAAPTMTAATTSPISAVWRRSRPPRAGGSKGSSAAVAAPTAASPCSDAAIGVKASEDVVAEVGEDHRRKREEQDHGAARAAPTAQRAGVQIDAVDEPGKEGGGLFRIPLPIGAPGAV